MASRTTDEHDAVAKYLEILAEMVRNGMVHGFKWTRQPGSWEIEGTNFIIPRPPASEDDMD